MTVSLRVPAAIVGVIVALALVVAFAGTGSASAPAIQGDANCNGVVDAGDALSILLQMAGAPVANSACVFADGDTDCDGDADESDALAVLSYIAEYPDATASGAGCVAIGDPLGTATPASTEPATDTPTGSNLPTPSPDTPTVSSATETATPTATGTGTPTSTSSSIFTLTATPTITPTPTVTPLLTPTPTATPADCGSLPSAAGDVVAEGATPATNGYTMTKLPADAGVDKMTNVVPVPGDPGLAIITSEPGKVWVICLGDNRARQEIADLTDVVRDKKALREETDEGLTSFIFEPGNPSVAYIIYSMPPFGTTSPTPDYLEGTATPGPNTVRSRLSRFQIVNGHIDRDSEEVILEIFQTYKWHQGDHLAFGPDGMLYISSGDSGFGEHGQSLDDLYGAILRIDVNSGAPYAVPTDNPLLDGAGGNADEVWAYGFRNPWRFTFDGDEMWISDVGEVDYEEVNIGKKGANYGWNIMEGHICAPANNATPPPTCAMAGLETPRAVYQHGNFNCAMTGGHVYHGSAMPELDGYYIYGDWCSGRIWALDTNNDQSAAVQLADTNLHPVSWAITNDGEIVAVSYFDATRPGLFPTPPAGGLAGIYKLERLP